MHFNLLVLVELCPSQSCYYNLYKVCIPGADLLELLAELPMLPAPPVVLASLEFRYDGSLSISS